MKIHLMRALGVVGVILFAIGIFSLSFVDIFVSAVMIVVGFILVTIYDFSTIPPEDPLNQCPF